MNQIFSRTVPVLAGLLLMLGQVLFAIISGLLVLWSPAFIALAALHLAGPNPYGPFDGESAGAWDNAIADPIIAFGLIRIPVVLGVAFVWYWLMTMRRS
jgi:hypothetical protein